MAAPAVEIRSLELQGFKSYRERVTLRSLGRFSCIIGPNGCGKSVLVGARPCPPPPPPSQSWPRPAAQATCLLLRVLQGEAIAFVLGGNKKMLRAKNLQSLVNQEAQEAGDNTAKVRTPGGGCWRWRRPLDAGASPLTLAQAP
jgi:hypothetical protein